MRSAAEEAGAEDDVGASVEERDEELAKVGGVVFEVGVLDDDEVAGDVTEAFADRCALAAMARTPRRWRC